MNEKFKSLQKAMNSILLFIAGISLVLLMFIGFGDVFARYFFSASFAPREELFRILLIVTFVTGFPVITLRHEHLDVDLLDVLFAKGNRRKIQFFFINLLVAISSLLLSYWMYDKSLKISRPGREVVFETLNIQQSIFAQLFALVLFLVGVIMILLAIRHIFAFLTKGKSDIEDIVHRETL